MPRMLSDIITDVIGGQADMEIVGDLASRGGLQAAVGATVGGVVLLGLVDSDLPGDCLPVFSVYPSIRMLGVAADGRRAFLRVAAAAVSLGRGVAQRARRGDPGDE